MPFGCNTSATIKDLDSFYEDRCFPKERGNCRDVLNRLGLDYYEPELICRKAHGQQFDDFVWIKFDTDIDLKYENIKLRD